MAGGDNGVTLSNYYTFSEALNYIRYLNAQPTIKSINWYRNNTPVVIAAL